MGRPRGSRNRIPSKSLEAQRVFRDQTTPQIEALASELIRIALHARRDVDRLRAMQIIFDRVMGPPSLFYELLDYLEEREKGPSLADLLAMMDQQAPPGDQEDPDQEQRANRSAVLLGDVLARFGTAFKDYDKDYDKDPDA